MEIPATKFEKVKNYFLNSENSVQITVAIAAIASLGTALALAFFSPLTTTIIAGIALAVLVLPLITHIALKKIYGEKQPKESI
jgi:hypothetical protein